MSTILMLAMVIEGQSLTVTWTHTGLDAKGNPEAVVKVEYGMAREGVSPNQVATAVEARGVVEFSGHTAGQPLTRTDEIGGLMAGLQGGTYRVWARVADAAGNWSGWTASTKTISLAPAAPTKVEVK